MYKNIKLIAIFIVVSLLGLGVYKISTQTQPPTEKIVVHDHQALDLSVEEFDKVKADLIELMNTHDPKFALSELRERTKTDNSLLRSCHPIAHEMGHAAFEKYGNFGEAMQYQDEICNSGYLHGIIESYFSKVSNIFSAMKTVCNSYPEGKFLSWECYHGVGHGVMFYTHNDLTQSLKLCDAYEDSFSSSSCTNGVFMENFNADQKLHTSKFLNEKDPFYPCAQQNSSHKSDCYLYAPTYYLSLHKNDYLSALKWCQSAEPAYKSACAQGVGSQSIKENINSPKLVEKMCMNGAPEQMSPCLNGLVSLYINHYGSLEPAKKLCEQLESDNKKACYSTVQAMAGLF